MRELRDTPWIRGHNKDVYSATPLVTPGTLSLSQASLNQVHTQITVTMDAFHKAQRAGFLLQDVTKAPLAQRRQKKRSSGSSTDSCGSSLSRGSLTPTKHLFSNMSKPRSPASRNLSNNSSSSSVASLGFTPLTNLPGSGPMAGHADAAATQQQTKLTATEADTSGYFSFKESRIAALMPSVPHVAVVAEKPECSSDGNARRGVKRPAQKDDSNDDDDDCIIITGDASDSRVHTSRTPSDLLNNNGAAPAHKKLRSDGTIVLD